MLRFRVAGAEVSVSFWFFALLALAILPERGALLFYWMLPIAVHELGHLLAMVLLRVPVRGICCSAFGIAIRRGAECEVSYHKDALISAAGPLANVAMAAVLHLTCFPGMRTLFLVAVNLVMAGFHLLPVGDLDGGRLLQLLLTRYCSAYTARRLSRIVSFLIAGMLTGLAVFLLCHSLWNPSLLVICGYLILCLLVRE